MLLSHIKNASNVENVILHDDVLTTQTNQEFLCDCFSHLLRCLPCLPKLRQLRIYISRRSTMDYAILKQVIQDCHRLEQFVVCDGSVWQEQPAEVAFALTTPQQVEDLAASLRYHPSLMEVSFQECFVTPDFKVT